MKALQVPFSDKIVKMGCVETGAAWASLDSTALSDQSVLM